MKPAAKLQKLAKMMTYVLGCRPDEFGLVPDADGFVEIKTLLQALHEEEGWRHLRLGNLNELVTTMFPAPVEIHQGRIRAADRSGLPQPVVPETPPKLLYLAIRRRAYATVREKGMRTSPPRRLVLSSDQAMARRLGHRIDNAPVILTVQVAAAMARGSRYRRYGGHLFLTDTLVPGTFSGPALPKEKPHAENKPAEKEPAAAKTPGSYYPDPEVLRNPGGKRTGTGKRKRDDWKKARREERRHKLRQQR